MRVVIKAFAKALKHFIFAFNIRLTRALNRTSSSGQLIKPLSTKQKQLTNENFN
jgi:hypothetical protein